MSSRLVASVVSVTFWDCDVPLWLLLQLMGKDRCLRIETQREGIERMWLWPFVPGSRPVEIPPTNLSSVSRMRKSLACRLERHLF